MHNKKIMVVDDEEAILRIVKTRLEKSGFDVVGVNDSSKALDEAKTARPDLIILDILMPGIDGIELAGLLKSDPATSRIPVIFLTCLKKKEEEGGGGTSSSAGTIIAKPFDSDVLLDEINRCIL
jgi:two-component system phosphate regulon response regulator PhoB